MNGTEPRIRFKEFGGEWEADLLSRHLSASEERNENNRYGAADVFSVSREHGVVNQIEFQGRSFAGASLLGYRVIHKGQVAYTKSPLKAAPYGIVKADKTKSGIVSALYGVYDAIADADFVQTFFENDDRLNAYLRPLVNKGAKNTLLVSDEDALSGEVRFPSLPEQQRIAELFRNLDETIAATDARLEKLRQSKKSLLEKMFPRPGASVPEIRFKGFEGEWEQKRLQEIVEFNPSARLPECFEYVDLESVVGNQMTFHRRVLRKTAPSRAQRLAKRGDVFFQTVRPYQQNNYLFDLESKVAFVFSTGYAQMRGAQNSPFLLSALQSKPFLCDVLNNCTGSGYPAISDSRLSELSISIPSLPEQQRIGAFFCEFDKLIESVQKKAAKLRQVKSALLEEMFV